MTVGELRDYLATLPADALVVRHDNSGDYKDIIQPLYIAGSDGFRSWVIID